MLEQFKHNALVEQWLDAHLQLHSMSSPFGELSKDDNKQQIHAVLDCVPQIPYLLDLSLQSTDDDDDAAHVSAAAGEKHWRRTRHKERTELAQYVFHVLDQAAIQFKTNVGGGPTPTTCEIAEAKVPLSIAQGIAYLQRPFPASESESSHLDPDALKRAAEARWSRQNQEDASTTPQVLYADVLAGLIDLPRLVHLLVSCSPARMHGPLADVRCSLRAPRV